MKLYLYELIDSIRAEPFYIGISSNPEQRLASHLSSRKSKSTDKWEAARSARISEIIDNGGQLCLNIIGECEPEYRKMAESYFYILYILNGATLLQSPLKSFLQAPDPNRLKRLSTIYDYRFCCDNGAFAMYRAPKDKKSHPGMSGS
jgi:hypothetical protein